ncbi:hypothetical protein GVAV_002387 [Gurleya vavrai]
MDNYTSLVNNRISILSRLANKISKNSENNDQLILDICTQKYILEKPNNIGKSIKTIQKEVKNTEEFKALIYGEDEFVSVEKNKRKKCPLTQNFIENEWVGKCGHFFERSAAVSYFKEKKVKCPVTGCEIVLSYTE